MRGFSECWGSLMKCPTLDQKREKKKKGINGAVVKIMKFRVANFSSCKCKS